MRRIMIQNGYKLLCKDICNDGYPYEDWYVHPDLVDMNYINTLITSDSITDEQIKKRLR